MASALHNRVQALEDAQRARRPPVGVCANCAGQTWRALLLPWRHAGPCTLDDAHGPDWAALLRPREVQPPAGKTSP